MKSIKYLNSLLNYLIALTKLIISKQKAFGIQRQKRIGLNLRKNILGRRLFTVCYYFIESNYVIYLPVKFKFLNSLKDFGRNLIEFENVRPKLYKKGEGDMYLHIGKSRIPILNGSSYYQNTEKEQTYHFPIGMHPECYLRGLYQKNENSLLQTRNIKVFFAGYVDKAKYNRDIIKNQFNLNSRPEIIEHIQANFSSCKSLQDPAELEQYLSQETEILIVDNMKVRLELETYFSFLERSDFFLTTPGVHYPLCHNTIEAMSRGVIPILAYPEYFYPQLVHGKNCFSFKNLNELVEVTQEALKLEPQKKKAMRRSVLDYYHQHLTPQAIVQNFEKKHQKSGLESVYILSK